MKHHAGIKTLLIKVTHEAQLSLQSLFETLLKAKHIPVDHGLMVYQLPDGTLIELYGPGACYPPFLFSKGDVVIGYRVHNLTQTIEQLTAAGNKLLSDVVDICTNNCYCFMLIQGTQIVGLYQMPTSIEQAR